MALQQLLLQPLTAGSMADLDRCPSEVQHADASPPYDIEAVWQRFVQPAQAQADHADEKLGRAITPASVLVQHILTQESGSTPATSPRALPAEPPGEHGGPSCPRAAEAHEMIAESVSMLGSCSCARPFTPAAITVGVKAFA